MSCVYVLLVVVILPSFSCSSVLRSRTESDITTVESMMCGTLVTNTSIQEVLQDMQTHAANRAKKKQIQLSLLRQMILHRIKGNHTEEYHNLNITSKTSEAGNDVGENSYQRSLSSVVHFNRTFTTTDDRGSFQLESLDWEKNGTYVFRSTCFNVGNDSLDRESSSLEFLFELPSFPSSLPFYTNNDSSTLTSDAVNVQIHLHLHMKGQRPPTTLSVSIFKKSVYPFDLKVKTRKTLVGNQVIHASSNSRWIEVDVTPVTKTINPLVEDPLFLRLEVTVSTFEGKSLDVFSIFSRDSPCNSTAINDFGPKIEITVTHRKSDTVD